MYLWGDRSQVPLSHVDAVAEALDCRLKVSELDLVKFDGALEAEAEVLFLAGAFNDGDALSGGAAAHFL